MKPHDNPEIKKKCDCGPECTCGCNEGKECHCGHGCKCGCGRGCGGKIIALLIVFLAGMGFNELMHGCFGRCPHKARPAAMMPAPHGAMPGFAEAAGTVVIVNTDGHADVKHASKCGCGKHHHNGMKPHHDGMRHHHGMPPKAQEETPSTETAAE